LTTKLLIRDGTLITPFERIQGASLLIKRGVIRTISTGELTPDDSTRVIDASGLFVAPGFIDLQLNGACGVDCMKASRGDLERLGTLLPRFGCTSYLPTFVTASTDRLTAALATIADLMARDVLGARPLGAHLEGPYLALAYKGAHDPGHIRPFRLDEWETFVAAARGHIRLVTVAPEVKGNELAVATMRRSGTVVSLGHTDATYAAAQTAVLNGACMVTHVHNAMRPLHHREPGMVGAALDLRGLTAGLIADGIHVHPATMRVLFAAKGVDAVATVTDASWVAGLSPGTYPWEGRTITFDGRAPRLPDGTLAGSGMTMDAMLRVLVEQVGLTLPDAVRTMTSTPARVLGIAERVGSLSVGMTADLTLLTTKLEVAATFIAGELAYGSDLAVL
jgi:N-acetylglucosamine-6-phosphate deacetylase